nr:Lipoprotein signal peptidase [Ipomoea batatas]
MVCNGNAELSGHNHGGSHVKKHAVLNHTGEPQDRIASGLQIAHVFLEIQIDDVIAIISNERVNSQQKGTISTGMASPLPPKCPTSFDSSTITTNFLDAASTIFSRSSDPPRPFTRFMCGSTSSAPSMARSRIGCAFKSDKGIPSATACAFPNRKSSAIRSTACLAVDPVPNPTTIPDSTYSTALYAASFFNSSWLSKTGEICGAGGSIVFRFSEAAKWRYATAIARRRNQM